jgi:hypothetical protein
MMAAFEWSQLVHSDAGPQGGTKRPGKANIYLTTKHDRKTIQAAMKILARLVEEA